MTKKDWEIILSLCETKKYSKGDILIQKGQRTNPPSIHYITAGKSLPPIPSLLLDPFAFSSLPYPPPESFHCAFWSCSRPSWICVCHTLVHPCPTCSSWLCTKLRLLLGYLAGGLRPVTILSTNPFPFLLLDLIFGFKVFVNYKLLEMHQIQ